MADSKVSFYWKKLIFHWKIAFSEVKIYKMALNMNPKSFGSDKILKILQENKRDCGLWFVYIHYYGIEIPSKMWHCKRKHHFWLKIPSKWEYIWTQNLLAVVVFWKYSRKIKKIVVCDLSISAIMEWKFLLKCDILSENTIFDWKYLQKGKFFPFTRERIFIKLTKF